MQGVEIMSALLRRSEAVIRELGDSALRNTRLKWGILEITLG